MRMAFAISHGYGLPVFIRITRSYALQQGLIIRDESLIHIDGFDLSGTIAPRFVPYPVKAVAKNQELMERMAFLRSEMPSFGLNKKQGVNTGVGMVVCGHAASKLAQVVELTVLEKYCRVLLLQTVYPLSADEIIPFLSELDKVLVLEENTPMISRQLMVIASNAGVQVKWETLTHPGELFRWEIANRLNKEFPDLAMRTDFSDTNTEMPVLKNHCAGSRYDEVLDLLDACSLQIGKQFHYYGDPGCLVGLSERLWAKFAMGGSVATAFGANEVDQSILNVALIGDSGFFHSALLAIGDAAYHKADIPMVLLNNNTARTTGGQLHPGSVKERLASRTLHYQTIMESFGVDIYTQINLDQGKAALLPEVSDFMRKKGLRLLQIDIEIITP